MSGRGEMVDTQVLGTCARKGVGVQVPSSAHLQSRFRNNKSF